MDEHSRPGVAERVEVRNGGNGGCIAIFAATHANGYGCAGADQLIDVFGCGDVAHLVLN